MFLTVHNLIRLSLALSQTILCFHNLPEFSSIKYDGKHRFKKDKFIDKNGVEWTVEGEWLDGLPNSICIFENENSRGVTTFTKGKEHGGPGWC
jgi:hypothetical protein